MLDVGWRWRDLNPRLPPCERVGAERHANLHLPSSRRTVRGEVRWRDEGELSSWILGRPERRPHPGSEAQRRAIPAFSQVAGTVCAAVARRAAAKVGLVCIGSSRRHPEWSVLSNEPIPELGAQQEVLFQLRLIQRLLLAGLVRDRGRLCRRGDGGDSGCGRQREAQDNHEQPAINSTHGGVLHDLAVQGCEVGDCGHQGGDRAGSVRRVELVGGVTSASGTPCRRSFRFGSVGQTRCAAGLRTFPRRSR
jgi:hypothetical protein